MKFVGVPPDDPVELEKLIAKNFPLERAALKKLAIAKELELINLRAEVNRLREQAAAGDGKGPAAAPPSEHMTALNLGNLTGQDIAELYHQYTGKQVLVSAEAAQV